MPSLMFRADIAQEWAVYCNMLLVQRVLLQPQRRDDRIMGLVESLEERGRAPGIEDRIAEELDRIEQTLGGFHKRQRRRRRRRRHASVDVRIM